MVLGVDEEECLELEDRYNTFKTLFPNMELVSKSKLRILEPNVVRISNHRDRRDLVNAIVVQNEHSAVNFSHLATSFLEQAAAVTAEDPTKLVDAKNNTEVKSIEFNNDETYTVRTNKGNVQARYVVVSACGYSLLFAHRLGYGLRYSCMPVAGDFFTAKRAVK